MLKQSFRTMWLEGTAFPYILLDIKTSSHQCKTYLVAFTIFFKTLRFFTIASSFVPGWWWSIPVPCFLQSVLLLTTHFNISITLENKIDTLRRDYHNYCWRVSVMLNNLWSKCKRITRFDLLSYIKNCVLIFRLVKAVYACARIHTINSSRKALTITANDKEYSWIKLQQQRWLESLSKNVTVRQSAVKKNIK